MWHSPARCCLSVPAIHSSAHVLLVFTKFTSQAVRRHASSFQSLETRSLSFAGVRGARIQKHQRCGAQLAGPAHTGGPLLDTTNP